MNDDDDDDDDNDDDGDGGGGGGGGGGVGGDDHDDDYGGDYDDDDHDHDDHDHDHDHGGGGDDKRVYFVSRTCRVVTVTIKCYHDIKTRMQLSCRLPQQQNPLSSASPSLTSPSSAADEYHDHYIRPLVEQTRSMVQTNCSLHPTYRQYYNESPGAHSFRFEPLTLSSIVALIS